MDTAARGLIASPTRAAVDRFLDARMHGEADKDGMFRTVERARELFARLVGASPDEIAFVKNVSEGLNAVATALPWRAGDNLVMCPEVEHPNAVYVALNLRRRLGIEVRAVPARNGAAPAEELGAAVDGRTRLVLVSAVSLAPGRRVDLEPLAAACSRHDSLLLVDGAQSVGVLHTDVAAQGIDALSASTQKGLLGFYGMGFLYCRREWAERLSPVYLARFGVDLGAAHEAAFGGGEFRLQPGAKRFDVGNYNYVGATAAEAALDLLLSYGTRRIESYVRGLAEELARGALAAGLTLSGGEPGPDLGHIVCLGRLGEGHDIPSDPLLALAHQRLLDAGARLSVRRDCLRLSLHLYNDRTDVDRVLELLSAFPAPSTAGR